MQPETHHNIFTLKELLDERHSRYQERYEAQKDAVKLAKDAADAARGTVNIVGLISVMGLILSIAGYLK